MKDSIAVTRRNTGTFPVGTTAIGTVMGTMVGIVSCLVCVCVMGGSVSATETSFLKSYPLTYRSLIQLCSGSVPSEVHMVRVTLPRSSVPTRRPCPIATESVPPSQSLERSAMPPLPTLESLPVIEPLPSLESDTEMEPLPTMSDAPTGEGSMAPLPVMESAPELPDFPF